MLLRICRLHRLRLIPWIEVVVAVAVLEDGGTAWIRGWTWVPLDRRSSVLRRQLGCGVDAARHLLSDPWNLWLWLIR